MLGNGYLPSRSKEGFTWVEPDDDVVCDFNECISSEFDLVYTHKKWHTNAWSVCIVANKDQPKNVPNQFALWIEDFGLRGIYSKDRFIPSSCFMWNTNSIANLLKALFTSDGSVDKQGHITLASNSTQLLLDVKILLLRFGIVSRVYISKCSKLVIASNIDIYKFHASIGFVGHKQEKLSAILKTFNKDQSKNHATLLPSHVTSTLIDNGFHGLIREQKLTTDRFAKMVSTVNELKFYSSTDILWDEIKYIQEDGEEQTYDVNVPGNHNFIVDGFITHNTGLAEALAWMVLMLYNPTTDWHSEPEGREEYFLPERVYSGSQTGYVICWKVRGGFRKHLEDSPGAIAIPFRGDTGWHGTKGKWFSLKKR
jgi:replicative DNA helicase